jgi:hypothetical protein
MRCLDRFAEAGQTYTYMIRAQGEDRVSDPSNAVLRAFQLRAGRSRIVRVQFAPTIPGKYASGMAVPSRTHVPEALRFGFRAVGSRRS